ncbi:MAG: Fructose-bisphosphate aldolase [Firmicutes bacterium ADurb.Bin373]|nr:MAG: Fructose-bisphosphate aldolase [Firmicutes bacterium ADurb.Bin373]
MQLSKPGRSFAFLWAVTLILRPGAAQEPETISRTLAPVYAPLAEQIVNDYELRERRGTAIDLGSGPGDLIIELCKRTRWLWWVNADINPSVFPGFLERARAAGFGERVEAVQADVHALPFSEAYADIVVSRGSYPFWKDKVKAFGEVYRVLKPGGVAFIGRGFSENLPLDVAREVRERQRKGGKEPVYDVEQAAAELAEIMRSLEIKEYRIRIPRRGDVNYGVWVEFRKPGPPPEPVTLLEQPGKESVGLDLSTTVVKKAEMEELGAETVIDALGFVPGAWIESRGRKVKQFLSFRGQKYPYPEYAIDGVLFREFHEVPYFLSTGDIERVEVMRSGGAMMAGNAGLVGLINVVPRVYSERQISVQVEYGSFGTAHGQYKGIPELDFPRLKKIKSMVNLPIVLHGSSGVPDDAIREAIRLGVRKVNIDTNIREAFVRAARKALDDNPQEIDPRKMLGPAREAATLVIREKMRIFGSSGKA